MTNVFEVALAVHDEIVALAQQRQDSSLCGYCALGAFRLWYELYQRGIQATFVRGSHLLGFAHCWVVYDGFIWDVTYTQFDVTAPPVYTPLQSDGCYQPEEFDLAALNGFEDWGWGTPDNVYPDQANEMRRALGGEEVAA